LDDLDLRIDASKQGLGILDCLQALFYVQKHFLMHLSERVQVLVSANMIVRHCIPPV